MGVPQCNEWWISFKCNQSLVHLLPAMHSIKFDIIRSPSEVSDCITGAVGIDSHETYQYWIDLRIFHGLCAMFDCWGLTFQTSSTVWCFSHVCPIVAAINIWSDWSTVILAQTMTNSGFIHHCQYRIMPSQGFCPLKKHNSQFPIDMAIFLGEFVLPMQWPYSFSHDIM